MVTQTQTKKTPRKVKAKRRKRAWGEWPDEQVPKRGTKTLTPIERAM